MELSPIRMAIAVGGLVVTMAAGTGIASAEPNLGAAVNTTCTYPQFVSALDAQNPAAGAVLNASPQMQSTLRQFIDAPRDMRQKMATAIVNYPPNKPYIGLLQSVFDTCNNF
ncbi:hemophore-related protein [Mycolicibacterium goodii]|uniref:hemophore-related protein n=1 Tax=Mycolicibacterium goodii TaxID=134601 RepID=UPI0018EC21D1|nr:hemophore-related protein [Mycolicibacterium goodii]